MTARILAFFPVLSLTALSGCATCQQRPVWCAVGTAVVVGSIAATVAANSGDHGSSTRQIFRTPGPQVCPPAGC
jgi:hypothetical protein